MLAHFNKWCYPHDPIPFVGKKNPYGVSGNILSNLFLDITRLTDEFIILHVFSLQFVHTCQLTTPQLIPSQIFLPEWMIVNQVEKIKVILVF